MTGTGTSPESITFTSLKDGSTYAAEVDGGTPATYSINLPNGQSYSVTIKWKFLGIAGGTANVGTLNLDTFKRSIAENWAS